METYSVPAWVERALWQRELPFWAYDEYPTERKIRAHEEDNRDIELYT